jgi:hypothetical protein
MDDEFVRFRKHASNCRALAENARDEAARLELLAIAEELESEADRIERELAPQPRKLSPRRD